MIDNRYLKLPTNVRLIITTHLVTGWAFSCLFSIVLVAAKSAFLNVPRNFTVFKWRFSY